jgi:hypothetical protein
MIPETTSPTNYPVRVTLRPATEGRDRLTTAFRFFLAIPHLVLVGGPVAIVCSIAWSSDDGTSLWYGSGGLISVVAGFVTLLAWFAILFTGRHPEALRNIAAWYLRWRVRAIAYMTLLRDEYPPFGDGAYAAELGLQPAEGNRNRLTVLFRLLLALPHMFVLWLLSMAWAFTTAIAWISILLTGRYPLTLYGFAIGVLAWSTRVEAYMLLLSDDYPPFTLRA